MDQKKSGIVEDFAIWFFRSEAGMVVQKISEAFLSRNARQIDKDIDIAIELI